MSNGAEKEKTPVKIICPDCGKPKVPKGSITGWLFSEKHCTCLSGGLLTPSSGGAPAAGSRMTEIEGDDSTTLPQGALGQNYQFLAELGRGGMGSVYQVKDLTRNKVFAAKILNSEMAGNPEAMKRFYKECEALAQLTHPHVVAVYEHGQTESGFPFLIMDYIDGYSLADVLNDEVYINPGRALGLFIPVAEALAYAHEKGILHRDLKPGNIMLTRSETEETVKLVDFGIAKVLEGNSRMTQDLTQTGEVLGTPLYMSPEQCLGFQLDPRSDIYSFGCLMCETVTGKPPFSGENAMQIVARHLSEVPDEASDRLDSMDTPRGLQDVILTCLAKDANDRYPDFETLLADLRAVVEGRRPSHSTSRVSHKLRSAYVGVVLELLPFAVPVTVFTLIYFFKDFSGKQVEDHCLVASAVAIVLMIYYFLKAYYLKASSSLLDKKGTGYSAKVKTFYTTATTALIFCLSQSLIYLDYSIKLEASGLEKIKYSHPWYFVLFWLTLAAIPFIAHYFYKNSGRQ